MFSLKLLGGVVLEGAEGRVTGPAAQRHRVAILALLASSHPRTLTRDKVMARLWPESDTEHARRLLNQAVHVLRRALGPEAILSLGEELQLNATLVNCDVIAFEEALSAGELERSARLYAGPFLDGFFLSEVPEFEQWLGRERDRLSAAYAGALEGLAHRAEAAGDRLGAVGWWKTRAGLDPYDSSIALHYILALDASGNRAAALLEAGTHQRLLKDELDMAPPPNLLELMERLRSSPSVILPRTAGTAEPPARRGVSAGDSAPSVTATAPDSPRPPRTPLWPVYATAAILILGALGVMLLRSGPKEALPAIGTVSASVDDIAKAVARELDRRQRGDTAVRLPPRRTRSIAAYELYLRGSDPAVLRTDSAARQGLEYFRRAVALDSGYAAAWAGLARMTVRTAADMPVRKEALDRAESAARRAMELDDSLADAHTVLGMVMVRGYQYDLAEAELRRAIALEPGTARNYEYLARLYSWRGRNADALVTARHALELEPLSSTATAELARAFLANGQYDRALAELEKIADIDPPVARAMTISAQCYAGKKMWKEAAAVVRASAEGGGNQTIGLYGYLLARGGRQEEAYRVLDRISEQNRSKGGQALNVALVYAGLANVDSALAWLGQAVDDHLLTAISEAALTVRVILESRPQDPRVVSLRQRLGLQNR